MAARHFTSTQIDQVIAVLRSKDESEFISRGRSGSGFGHRAGQLYLIYVEDQEQQDHPIGEAELRARLAAIDLDNYSERYDIWAVQSMGIAVEGPTLTW